MPDFKYVPLKHLDAAQILPLMEEEEQKWMSDLNWDYSPIRNILLSFIKQKLLPGYAAVVNENDVVGYAYFLVNQSKGIIGALYTAKMNGIQAISNELLANTIACLKDYATINRIEAQIMPFHDLDLTAIFIQNGFSYHPRCYMELDLNAYDGSADLSLQQSLHSWDGAYLERMGQLTVASYHNQIDAEICEDYCSQSGCTGYIRSLVENPGCGIFMPEASAIALNEQGDPCGYILCSRISERCGMVPQIALHPAHQGHGLGGALMHHSLCRLRDMGFHSVTLTVTEANAPAFRLYQRLGFQIRKHFGGFVWRR